jgi:CRP-like cAMP-binding protein
LDEIEVGPGKLLVKEGDRSGAAFLIVGGRVEIFRAVNGVKHRLAVLGAGEIAGEMGLLNNAPRSACIATMESTRLVMLSPELVARQMKASPPLVRFVLHSLIQTLRTMTGIPAPESDPLLDGDPIVSERTYKLLRRETYPAGRVIFRRGDEGHYAYLVQSGMVEIWKETVENEVQVLGRVGPGRVFGEMALLRNANRAASVTAVELTVCEVIPRNRFDELLRMAPPMIRQLVFSYINRIEAGM